MADPKPTQEPDIGWRHGKMVGGNRFHWQCDYCKMIGKGGGVSRLKKHIAGDFPEVSKCKKVSQKVHRAMKTDLDSVLAAKKAAKQKQTDIDRRTAEYHTVDEYEEGDEMDPNLQARIRASRDCLVIITITTGLSLISIIVEYHTVYAAHSGTSLQSLFVLGAHCLICASALY
ncbi:uncharacterized protein [Typha latifolia]|uniref:uncharacterized protein n=1 Tax=Typha latifolia TaxID=4733 RepID=UPI003C2DA928